MAKYDWEKIKQDYMTTDAKCTLKQFALDRNIPYNLLRQKATGWRKNKQTKNEQKTNKIIDKTIEKQIEHEVDINTRHLKISNDLLNAIELCTTIEALKTIEVKDGKPFKLKFPSIGRIKELSNSLEKLQKIQRIATGQDNGKGNENIIKDFMEAVINGHEETN